MHLLCIICASTSNDLWQRGCLLERQKVVERNLLVFDVMICAPDAAPWRACVATKPFLEEHAPTVRVTARCIAFPRFGRCASSLSLSVCVVAARLSLLV